MSVLLWILQAVLALLLLSGGAYKLSAGAQLAKDVGALSRGAWAAFGAFEIVGAILLIVPAALSWMPGLTALAAVAVAVESLVLSLIYARTSRSLTASNPLLWSAMMGLIAAFVAYGRYVLSPLS
jgi:hypothetical protein